MHWNKKEVKRKCVEIKIKNVIKLIKKNISDKSCCQIVRTKKKDQNGHAETPEKFKETFACSH